MRTTVTFAEDVAAAIQQLRRERSLGLSEAVNELIQAGLMAPARHSTFKQKTYPLGLKIDVTNTGEALGRLDGPSPRR